MKAELLAPAGSFESLEAALFAGADAVYLGGNQFGARAYAKNLPQERLLEAIDLCHLRGKSLYLTVNTLLKEEELEKELYAYLAPLYEAGLDAAIVQDFGVFRFLKREFPGLALHASTQMTIHSAMGAKFLAEQGASRVVTARELSLEEIREIHRSTDVEIESFIHGALCYCYSGQCLLSSVIGGRSGNRGRCAQPCRLPYSFGTETAWQMKEKYLLSPKDICTLDILPDILEAGVFSLKIEGRMKSPAYTAEVVRIYRRYLDQYRKNGKKAWKIDPQDRQDLMDLYNRGGFSKGYYQVRNGKEMMSIHCPSHFGTEGAVVLQNQKGILKLKALEDLHKQDVLESYTLGEDVPKGKTFRLRVAERKKEGEVLRRTKNAALLQEIDGLLNRKQEQEKINGKLIISPQKPAILILNSRGQRVEVFGDPVQEARTQGLTAEKLKKQLEKTGNTPFCFEHLEIDLQPGCFLPVQSINELRRKALEELQAAILQPFRRSLTGERPTVDEAGRALRVPDMRLIADDEECLLRAPDTPPIEADAEHALRAPDTQSIPDSAGICRLNASVETEEQLLALLPIPGIHRIYLESDCLDASLEAAGSRHFRKLCHDAGKECWISLPRIFRSDIQNAWSRSDTARILAEYDGILLKNLEEYRFLLEQGAGWKQLLADHSVYLFNRETRAFWKEQGIHSFTAHLEANVRELEKLGCEDSELLVYGRIPLMASAQCLLKTTGRCTKTPGLYWLKDRTGARFPVRNHCTYCRNTIYNSAPLALLKNKTEIEKLHPASLRLAFTVEDKDQTESTAKLFASAFLEGAETPDFPGAFTRGHFKRGVE